MWTSETDDLTPTQLITVVTVRPNQSKMLKVKKQHTEIKKRSGGGGGRNRREKMPAISLGQKTAEGSSEH